MYTYESVQQGKLHLPLWVILTTSVKKNVTRSCFQGKRRQVPVFIAGTSSSSFASISYFGTRNRVVQTDKYTSQDRWSHPGTMRGEKVINWHAGKESLVMHMESGNCFSVSTYVHRFWVHARHKKVHQASSYLVWDSPSFCFFTLQPLFDISFVPLVLT